MNIMVNGLKFSLLIPLIVFYYFDFYYDLHALFQISMIFFIYYIYQWNAIDVWLKFDLYMYF